MSCCGPLAGPEAPMSSSPEKGTSSDQALVVACRCVKSGASGALPLLHPDGIRLLEPRKGTGMQEGAGGLRPGAAHLEAFTDIPWVGT